jgi:hypothetical protein
VLGVWLGGALPAPMRTTILGALRIRTARSAPASR